MKFFESLTALVLLAATVGAVADGSEKEEKHHKSVSALPPIGTSSHHPHHTPKPSHSHSGHHSKPTPWVTKVRRDDYEPPIFATGSVPTFTATDSSHTHTHHPHPTGTGWSSPLPPISTGVPWPGRRPIPLGSKRESQPEHDKPVRK